MSKYGLFIVVFFLTLFAGSPISLADPVSPCQTVSVASILGTSCSIGGQTYHFDSSAWTGSLPANDVLFTPDDSNPDRLGFILSLASNGGNPQFSLTSGSTDVQEFPAILEYTANITDPNSGEEIFGGTVTQTGAAEALEKNDADPAAAHVIDSMSFSSCTETLSLLAGMTHITGLFGPSVTFQSSVGGVPGIPGCSGVTQAMGDARIFLEAENNTVSITTGGFYVDEIAASTTTLISATPEPSSFVLMGAGLLGLAGVVRRRLST